MSPSRPARPPEPPPHQPLPDGPARARPQRPISARSSGSSSSSARTSTRCPTWPAGTTMPFDRSSMYSGGPRPTSSPSPRPARCGRDTDHYSAGCAHGTKVDVAQQAPGTCPSRADCHGSRQTGKTTAITQLGRSHERATARLHQDSDKRIPVVYATVPPVATPRMLAVGFAQLLGLPINTRWNQADGLRASRRAPPRTATITSSRST